MNQEENSPLLFLIGGSGFLGTEIALAALEAGWRVGIIDPATLGWSSDEEAMVKGSSWSPACLMHEEKSVLDFDDLHQETSAVVHLAADKGLGRDRDPLEILDYNTRLTLHSLTLAKRLPKPVPFLHASSAAVYTPTPQNTPYGVSKQVSEMLVSSAGLQNACNARVFNLHHPTAGTGVEAEMRRQAEAGGPIVVHGDGSQTRDLVPVEDAGKWLFLLASLGTKTKLPNGLDICTGTETRIISVAGRVSEETGHLISLRPKAPCGPKRSVGNPQAMRTLLGLDKTVRDC